jgi:hypothetical protein
VVVEVGPMTEPDYWDSEFSNEYLNREANPGDILLKKADTKGEVKIAKIVLSTLYFFSGCYF